MKNLEKLISSLSNLKLMSSALISIALAFIFVFFSTLINYSDYLSRDASGFYLNKNVSCEQLRQGKLPGDLNCDKISQNYKSYAEKPSSNPYASAVDQIIREEIEACNALKNGDFHKALDYYHCDYKKTNFTDWINWGEAIEGILVISIIAFLLISLLKLYYNEQSKGWKRLAITISMTASIIAPLCVRDEYDYGPIAILIIFFPILLIVLSFKKIYLWIQDGFEKDKI